MRARRAVRDRGAHDLPATSPSSSSAPAPPAWPPRSSSPATASPPCSSSAATRTPTSRARPSSPCARWSSCAPGACTTRRRRRRGGRLAHARVPHARRGRRAARSSRSAIRAARRARSLSPSAPECVAQDHLEPVLLDHLRTLGAAPRWRMGTELAAWRSRRGGVTATLRDVRTGAERVVRAGWLVAADGARSRSAQRLGIAMHGQSEVFAGVTATFRAPLWEVVGPHRHGIYSITRPEPECAALPARRPRDRWLIGFGRPSGTRRPPERIAALDPDRRRACPACPSRSAGSGSFTAAAQLAERYRAGRAFLAGDAAHRVTPRGGTGLNIAFQDGCDLGWKLAWVLNGWAAEPLLDTYEAERRPVAEHNAARSADPEGTVRAPEQELPRRHRRAHPHVWERRARLDARPPRPGPHALHRRRRAPLARRRGAAALPPPAHRPPRRADDGAGARHRRAGRRAARCEAGRHARERARAGATAPALRAAVAPGRGGGDAHGPRPRARRRVECGRVGTRNIPIAEAGPQVADVMLRDPRTVAPGHDRRRGPGAVREPARAAGARRRRRAVPRRDHAGLAARRRAAATRRSGRSPTGTACASRPASRSRARWTRSPTAGSTGSPSSTATRWSA